MVMQMVCSETENVTRVGARWSHSGLLGRRFRAVELSPCAVFRQAHSLAARKDRDPPVLLDRGTGSSSDLGETPSLPRFDSLKGVISSETLQAVTGNPFGLTHMSPVQAEVLPLLPGLAEPYDPEAPADGTRPPPRDLLVRAKTGTGKTLAFLIPAVEARLKSITAFVKQAVIDSGLAESRNLEIQVARKYTREHVGTLILSPTRELAMQIATAAEQLCCHHRGMNVIALVGGNGKGAQMRNWMKGSRDIVVATPGRLQDLLTSEPAVAEALSKTKLLVLDETDSLLDIGFREDIEAIKRYLPETPKLQTFLFSATVSPSIQQIARSSLDKNHLFINTVTDNATPVHDHIPQYHTILPDASHQIPHVLRLLAQDQLVNPTTSKTILFLPTTKMTQLFAHLLNRLARSSLPAGRRANIYEIHSKKQQSHRTRTSDAFRNDRSGAAILVSSDVSARGVDYPGVTRIIQVGIPGSPDQYVHRIGRTGRAGTGGRGDLILLPWEMNYVTSQLNEMPLKPLTVKELTKQVKDLATQYDEDPKSFTKNDLEGFSGRRARTSSRFISPVASAIDDLEQAVKNAIVTLDEEAVNEAFTSLLGYYVSKATEMRTDKSRVLQGCKDWTIEACGLETPPFVSEAFLNRLGLWENTRQRRTRNNTRGFQERPQRRSWEGRGGGQYTSSWTEAEDRYRPDNRRSRDSTRSPRSSGFQKRGDRAPFDHRSYGEKPNSFDRRENSRQFRSPSSRTISDES